MLPAHWPLRALAVTTFAAAMFAGQAARAQGHVLDNGRVHIDIDDPAYGSSANTNRFDSVTWTDSAGTLTGNLAASGGSPVCGDAYEFFGEARGDFSEEPRFIVAGVKGSWVAKSGQTKTARTSTHEKNCVGQPVAGYVTSTYTLSGKAATINRLMVNRVFKFNSSGSGANDDLRAFMPRLPDSSYDTVYVPSSSGAIQTYSALACDSICQVTDWNGIWFADDDGNGNGMMIIRSPLSKLPAVVDVDHDGASNSNDSAIALTPPGGGWSGTVTEIEYVCFYDPTSWNSAMRAAGELPTGCKVKGVK